MHGLAPTRENVLGVLSLVFWALNFVVSFKYIAFVLRADNRGEGGILALLALVRPQWNGERAAARDPRRRGPLRRGAAVRRRHHHAGHLGARRGRGPRRRHPASSRAGCRTCRRRSCCSCSWCSGRGTARVGSVFGPVMVVWFVCIALLGRARACRGSVGARGHQPDPCGALLPRRRPHRLPDPRIGGAGGDRRRGAVRRHGSLRPAPDPARVVRGGAAGAAAQLLRPGGWLLHHPDALHNPFYALVPAWASIPWSCIATAAAVVASQALISGRVLADPAGGAAGLLPAGDHPAHLGEGVGADLHPGGERAALHRLHRAGARLGQFDRRWPRPTASR